MRRLILFSVILLCAARANAQPITTYTLTIYQGSTTGTVQSTTPIPVGATGFVCNLARTVVTGPQVNPTKLYVNDPVNAGQDCVYTDPGTGPLAALPFGSTSYVATLKAVNSAGSSSEGAASNSFTRPGVVPTAPVGTRVGS